MAEVIITTFGSDGAASAALLLRNIPKAKIIVTSANRLGAALHELSAESKDRLYICGVGVGENLTEILLALNKLKTAKSETLWFCGRGYLDDVAKDLEGNAELVFNKGQSNCECICDYFKYPAKDKYVSFLLNLAADYTENVSLASDRKLPENRQWWHDFIRASADDYFKYDTLNTYKQCIKKLAGLAEVSEHDHKEVEQSRASGLKAQPLGNSTAIRKMRRLITRIGPVDAPVLIIGPSGAGKELAARLLHEASSRAANPFIAINCAILSANSDLAHDRLFGHVQGAYTGATSDSPGAFEAAEGGTLFLDEVAELPLSVQTQLLRALEEKEVSPLGTFKSRPVNVRIVAATNRPLQQMVENNEFRLDLYHRLNVLRLPVPSLSERQDDLKSIARSVIMNLKNEGHNLKISEKDWECAREYHWPGNVRQLINLLRRAAYMGMSLSEVINEERSLESAPVSNPADLSLFRPSSLETVSPEADIRRAYIRHVYELCDKSTTKAAQLLNITTNTLRAWL